MYLRQGSRDILLIVLVVLAVTMCVLCFCNAARGAEYHKNLVGVRCELGNKYSVGWGVYCEHRGVQGVLTVAHGLARQPNGNSEVMVTFFDGLRLVAHVTKDKYGHDVAFVTVAHPTLKPVLFSSKPPVVGQSVEFVSRRQPKYQLCSEIGTVAQVDKQGMACWGISGVVGDSGSPYFDMDHQVIGVHMLGEPDLKGAPPSVATDYKQTREFLDRIVQGCCPPGTTCPTPLARPLVRVQPGTQRIRIGPMAPVEVSPPVKASPLAETLDYDRLATLIYAKILANKEQFRGPVGLPGVPGLPGVQGESGSPGGDGASASINYERLTAEVLKRLPPVVIEIESSSGEVWRQSRPLGDPIRMGLFPQTGVSTLPKE